MRLRTVLVFLVLYTSCGGVDTSGLGLSSGTGGGGGSSVPDCGADTWSSYGGSFFASQCSSCHTHSGQFTTQASVQSASSRIASEISSGRMPEGGGLSSTERQRILDYLACGAP